MDYENFLSEKKKMQSTFLEYINGEEEIEEHFQNFIKLIEDQNIKKDINEFRLLLHFINNVSNNHYRTKDFFSKIESILFIFKDDFKKLLSNDDIFLLFEDNKRILLFLIENKILNFNLFMKEKINLLHYAKYFIKEQKEFESKENNQKDPNFDENRKTGENESKLYSIIRNDLISDFITYVTRNEISLKTTVSCSIYETNSFLLFEEPTLIEYAAFFGSIQIFNYLFKNEVQLTPSLWLYAMHGKNPEIIKILEDNKIVPEDKSYKECLREAIKCHHNEIVVYIKSNLIHNQIDVDEFIESESIKYYNYLLFPNYDKLYNRNNFYNFCKYDYFYFAEGFLMNREIDINFKTCDIINDKSYILTPLIIAIKNNSLSIAELLLKQPGIDVNFRSTRYNLRDSSERTFNAINLAIICNNPKMIELLLNTENINVNSILMSKEKHPNNTIEIIEFSPLFEVLDYYNNIQIFKILLSHPDIDVNMKSKNITYDTKDSIKKVQYRNSPILCQAIRSTDLDAIRILLEHPKIDVNATELNNDKTIKYKCEFTPLIVAFVEKNLEIIKILLSHPEIDINKCIIVENDGKTTQFAPLFYEIYIEGVDETTRLQVISLLLSHKKLDVNYYSSKLFATPLIHAVEHHKKDLITLLLSNPSIDVNKKYDFNYKNGNIVEKYPLSVALEKNYKEIALLLLNHPKIDVNIKVLQKKIDYTQIMHCALLHIAIRKKNIEIIKAILDDPNVDLNIKSFEKTIKNNATIEKEKTTMYEAIKSNNLEIIQLLLSKPGIDINMKMTKTVFENNHFFIEEKTPLRTAVNKKNVEIIQLLLSYLRKSGKMTDDLNDLMKTTNDNNVKSIIYDNINMQS